MMRLCLLTSDPAAAIQLCYFIQTGGFKFQDVIVVGSGGPEYKIIKDQAEKDKFSLWFVNNPNGPETISILKEIQPDILKIQLGDIIRKPVFEIPKIGTINCHAAVLPNYRGVDAPWWALLEGGDLGVSIHFIDEGVDTGPIVVTKKLPVYREDDERSILTRNHYTTKWQAVLEALRILESGKFKPVPQRPEEGRTYFAMHPSIIDLVRLKLRAER